MNHSIYSANRSTHLKIVIVALAAGIAVAGVAVSSRTDPGAGSPQTGNRRELWILCP
jgi:hypothetical protein